LKVPQKLEQLESKISRQIPLLSPYQSISYALELSLEFTHVLV